MYSEHPSPEDTPAPPHSRTDAPSFTPAPPYSRTPARDYLLPEEVVAHLSAAGPIDVRDGLMAPLRALGFILARPWALGLCLVPWLVNLLIILPLVTLVAYSIFYAPFALLIPDGWDWVAVPWIGVSFPLTGTLKVVLALAAMGLGLLAFYLLAGVVGAPFHDLMAEHAERELLADRPDLLAAPLPLKLSIRQAIRSATGRLVKLLPRLLLVLPVGLIPVVGAPLAWVLNAYFSAWFLTMGALDFPMDRRLVGTGTKWRYLSAQWPFALGFGVVCLLIPCSFILLPPIAAMAGTMVFCDALRRGCPRREEPQQLDASSAALQPAAESSIPPMVTPLNEANRRAVAGLEPAPLWQAFADLAALPRPSRQEGRVRDWLLGLARQHEWPALTDAAGNVCLHVPATAGRQAAPTVVLQAHMDMVTIAADGVAHDFDTTGISLERATHDGHDVIRARGTTLGADNGIGLAAALAAALDPAVEHGPLDLLFTVNEESGMTGAAALDPAIVRGRLLLNIDTEEDETIYIGCAGAGAAILRWASEAAAPPAGLGTVKVVVSGLPGGHSGLEIDQPRGNAIKSAAAFLHAHLGDDAAHLAALTGGTRRNALADRCEIALVTTPAAAARLAAAAPAAEQALRHALAHFGPHARLVVETPAQSPAMVMASAAASRRVVALLAALHHGPLAHDDADPSLVRTSNNAAIVKSRLDGGRLHIEQENGVRSLVREDVATLLADLRARGEAAGAEVETFTSYVPWTPRRDAPLLATAAAVHRAVFDGRSPKVAVIHAGLECGLLGERLAGLDMISIGPRIDEAHTPRERVHVKSVAAFWRYFRALLVELAR